MENMKILKSIALCIIAYMLIFPTPLSAEISPSQLEIIKIAFMNGYINAVESGLKGLKN
jgi:predicted DNA binding protein